MAQVVRVEAVNRAQIRAVELVRLPALRYRKALCARLGTNSRIEHECSVIGRRGGQLACPGHRAADHEHVRPFADAQIQQRAVFALKLIPAQVAQVVDAHLDTNKVWVIGRQLVGSWAIVLSIPSPITDATRNVRMPQRLQLVFDQVGKPVIAGGVQPHRQAVPGRQESAEGLSRTSSGRLCTPRSSAARPHANREDPVSLARGECVFDEVLAGAIPVDVGAVGRAHRRREVGQRIRHLDDCAAAHQETRRAAAACLIDDEQPGERRVGRQLEDEARADRDGVAIGDVETPLVARDVTADVDLIGKGLGRRKRLCRAQQCGRAGSRDVM